MTIVRVGGNIARYGGAMARYGGFPAPPAPEIPMYEATGGTITDDGTYITHTFTTSGTFTITAIPNKTPAYNRKYLYYLVVGGGGNGNYATAGTPGTPGGGGGGGQVQEALLTLGVSAGTYPITVAAAGGTSSFNGVNSVGGQTGGSYNGGNSGSGYTGGTGDLDTCWTGGGGAGNTSNGVNAVGGCGWPPAKGGDGGTGTTSSFFGEAYGGGGGGGITNGGYVGLGTDRGGNARQSGGGKDASVNSGSGGGADNFARGGYGGTGIVKIKYFKYS